MPQDTKNLVDLGQKPTEVSPKNEKYYPSINIPLDKMPELKGKDVGDKIALYVIGAVKGIHEEGVSIEIRQAGAMRKLTEEEYLSKSDEEKDDIDAEDLESKKPKEEDKE